MTVASILVERAQQGGPTHPWALTKLLKRVSCTRDELPWLMSLHFLTCIADLLSSFSGAERSYGP